MALNRWLKNNSNQVVVPKFPKPVFPDLPDPNDEVCPTEAKRIAFANESVSEARTVDFIPKKLRGSYSKSYDDNFRNKVAKFALANSNPKAAKKFGVPLTTVKTWRSQILKKIRLGGSAVDVSMVSIRTLPQGRPTLLPPDFDATVLRYIRRMRIQGSCISWKTVAGLGRGILEAEQPSLLKQFGGSIELDYSWAQSILRRVDFVRRKVTKTAQKLPINFEEKKSAFLFSVCAKVQQHQIPSALVLNWDQTGISMIPDNKFTLAPKGCKDVAVIGQDDKRQITVGVTCSLTGELLPFQVIYEGTTNKCHPNVDFPESWNVTHTKSHWSNSGTMLEWAEKVLIPYRLRILDQYELSPDQMGLLILDNHASHNDPDFLDYLAQNCFVAFKLPPNCTGELQPLDLSFNVSLKRAMRDELITYQAQKFREQIRNAEENLRMDLRLSEIKPQHAKWLIRSFDLLKDRPQIIKNGWKQAGIVEALLQKEEIFEKNNAVIPNPFCE